MTMTRDGKYESEREEPCRENRQAQRARNRAQENLDEAGDELAHALQGRRAHGYSGAHTDVAQHHEYVRRHSREQECLQRDHHGEQDRSHPNIALG